MCSTVRGLMRALCSSETVCPNQLVDVAGPALTDVQAVSYLLELWSVHSGSTSQERRGTSWWSTVEELLNLTLQTLCQTSTWAQCWSSLHTNCVKSDGGSDMVPLQLMLFWHVFILQSGWELFPVFTECVRLKECFNSCFYLFSLSFSIPGFIYGVRYNAKNKQKCQKIIFLIGEVKSAISVTWRDRLQTGQSGDVVALWKWRSD